MIGCAIFWIANGFDPQDSTKTDNFSRVALNMAVCGYSQLKKNCGELFPVRFVIVKSVVQNQDGRVLWETLLEEAGMSGIPSDDIVLTDESSINALSDGRVIALYARDNPNMIIKIYATGRKVARYFEIAYAAVGKHIVGLRGFEFQMNYPKTAPRPSFKSGQIYDIAKRVTWIAARNEKLFRWYYDLRHKMDVGRRESFVRTVQ